MSGDKVGAICHGNVTTLSDEVSIPRAADSLGRLHSAYEEFESAESTGIHEIIPIWYTPELTAVIVNTIAYAKA